MNPLWAGLGAVIGRGFEKPLGEEELDELLLAVHRDQYGASESLRKITALSGKAAPAENWRDIPLVPTRLFALQDITTFLKEDAAAVYYSSGTTRSESSRHYLPTIQLYRASSMAGAKWCLNDQVMGVRSCIEENPHSSLAVMAGWMAEEFGAEKPGHPVALIGTAFHFVNAFDRGQREELPAGSIVIETGGYKGKSREVGREELYDMIETLHGVPRARIVSEYGMCELSSPMWRRPGDQVGFRFAPWVRVRTLDPESLDDCDEGLIAIYDPVNIGSSVGILTGDLGRIENERLVLKGRLPGSDQRGCSHGMRP